MGPHAIHHYRRRCLLSYTEITRLLRLIMKKTSKEMEKTGRTTKQEGLRNRFFTSTDDDSISTRPSAATMGLVSLPSAKNHQLLPFSLFLKAFRLRRPAHLACWLLRSVLLLTLSCFRPASPFTAHFYCSPRMWAALVESVGFARVPQLMEEAAEGVESWCCYLHRLDSGGEVKCFCRI